MREWEIGAVENIHGALPYIRFAPILALVGVGVNRIGKETRMGKAGKREYVQVLRLLETFRLEEVEGAVGDAPAARRNRL